MAPSSFFHKPELALRRAIELQSIQQEDAAITLLHDVLSSRRHRTWSPIYENIMITYLDLCLEHHRSREAKDGLHQYRNLSQSQAPGSLEKVILYLITKAENACIEAKAYADLELKQQQQHKAKQQQNQATETAAAIEAAALAAAVSSSSTGAEEEEVVSPSTGDEELIGGENGSGTNDVGMFGGASSPEAIILSTMSIDPTKQQQRGGGGSSSASQDSVLLLPALKFLWETYRAVLDILRSSSKLEHVYHNAAQGALKFCRTYHRRMEFRHLCDMLRMHLGNLRQFGNNSYGEETNLDGSTIKTSSKVRGWEGWTSDSIELYLQTRFAQLETASVLHRYMEGFRTVEDIYNILQISHARRKAHPDAPAPKAKLMAAYYEKLTTLFWVSENYLFHGFAWYKFYTLCKEYNRGMSEEMKKIQASSVLLAALCIPQTSSGPSNNNNNTNPAVDTKWSKQQNQHGIRSTVEDDIVKQKMARMATLLGFHTRNPTREALLNEIRSKNILEQVPAYLRELYYLLEDTSDPMIMVEQAKPLLEQLQQQQAAAAAAAAAAEEVTDETGGSGTTAASTASLGRYVKPLTAVLLQKLIVNLASSYHTVSLDHLKKLTSGLEMFGLTFEQVEKAIIQFTLQANKNSGTGGSSSTSSNGLAVRIDHRANCIRFGDTNLESDLMRSQLMVLSKQLQRVTHVLHPTSSVVEETRLTARVSRLKLIRQQLPDEHRGILDRKNYIEECKEKAERLIQDKMKEEIRMKAEDEINRKMEEEKRIAREQKLRELEKQKRIQLELDNQEKKRFLVAMGKSTEGITEEQIAQIDTDALQKEHQEKLNKEKEDAERRTKEIAKKLDYLVRAVRIEELPRIQSRYEQKVEADRIRYEEEIRIRAETAKIQWEKDVQDKVYMEEYGVFKHFNTYEESIIQGRTIQHETLCYEAEMKAEEDAEKAKMKRARRRRDDVMKRKLAEELELKRKVEEEEEAAKFAIQEEESRQRKILADEQQAKQRLLQQQQQESSSTVPSLVNESTKTSSSAPPPRSLGGGGLGSSKYVPPSRRGASTTSSSGGGDRGGSSSYGGGDRDRGSGAYPGGGRYEGRSSRPGGADGGGGGGGGGSGGTTSGETWRSSRQNQQSGSGSSSSNARGGVGGAAPTGGSSSGGGSGDASGSGRWNRS